jgi:hypothetical protein
LIVTASSAFIFARQRGSTKFAETALADRQLRRVIA